MKLANPYLNFDGNTEAVSGFYRSVFGGAALLVPQGWLTAQQPELLQ